MNTKATKKEKDIYDLSGEWSDHFEISIKSESTRAKVILSACYLDKLLNQLLEILLKPNDAKNDSLFDGPTAPLSTFSAKIELAARMGTIDNDTKKSLHLVRKIRNQFAHSLSDCDFNDSKIENWNKELHELNDHASERRRATFSEGAIGDFEKSISWLVFWLRHITQQIPTECPNCGSEIEYRAKIKEAKPGEDT
ncbi:MAG: hypothetical protein ACYSTS_07170 [Planctomycetota bacterium]|jgi:DNA-binding MltR family transcriptional regulator